MAKRGPVVSWLPVPNSLNITGLGVLLAHHDLAHAIRSSSHSASERLPPNRHYRQSRPIAAQKGVQVLSHLARIHALDLD